MAKSINLNKKLLLSEQEMVREILAWYALAMSNPAQAEKDLEWYQTANTDCYEMWQSVLEEGVSITLDQVIDVVACVSPGKPWTANVNDARATIMAWHSATALEDRKVAYKVHGGGGVGYSWGGYTKSWDILDGVDTLKIEAEKTFRFADNLRNPQTSTYATIDQHMIHIMNRTGLRGSIGAGGYYLLLERVLITVATYLGIPPLKLQALLWGCRVALFAAGNQVDDIYEMILNVGK